MSAGNQFGRPEGPSPERRSAPPWAPRVRGGPPGRGLRRAGRGAGRGPAGGGDGRGRAAAEDGLGQRPGERGDRAGAGGVPQPAARGAGGVPAPAGRLRRQAAGAAGRRHRAGRVQGGRQPLRGLHRGRRPAGRHRPPQARLPPGQAGLLHPALRAGALHLQGQVVRHRLDGPGARPVLQRGGAQASRRGPAAGRPGEGLGVERVPAVRPAPHGAPRGPGRAPGRRTGPRASTARRWWPTGARSSTPRRCASPSTSRRRSRPSSAWPT